jgi:hypothetical protein
MAFSPSGAFGALMIAPSDIKTGVTERIKAMQFVNQEVKDLADLFVRNIENPNQSSHILLENLDRAISHIHLNEPIPESPPVFAPLPKGYIRFTEYNNRELCTVQLAPGSTKSQLPALPSQIIVSYVNDHFFIQEHSDSCEMYILQQHAKVVAMHFYYIGKSKVSFRVKKNGDIVAKCKDMSPLEIQQKTSIGIAPDGPWCLNPEQSGGRPTGWLVWTLVSSQSDYPIRRLVHSKLTIRKSESWPLIITNGMIVGFGSLVMRVYVGE